MEFPRQRRLPGVNLSKMRVSGCRGGAAALGLVLLSQAPAWAQAPRDLAPFRDSVARATPEQLREFERTLLASVRRDRANPALHLRLGQVALTLGELSDAVSEFKWVTQLAPQWGAAWLGLAQAELALGEVADTSRLGRRAFLARDAWDRAATALGRAVAADPNQAAQAVAVARDRVGRGLAASAEVIRDGLRRAVVARTRTAAAALALARVELMVGDTAAALIAHESAAALPGGRGPGLLGAARIRLARRDLRGVQLFYDAAATDDSASVAAIRADLATVATEPDLGLFDGRRGADRAAWLWQFWTRRDREELRATGERLAEHYRRLALSERYPEPGDQRALVLIRQGEPDSRAALRQPGIRPNESWRYQRPEGDLIVHFLADGDGSPFRLVPSVFDLVAPEAAGAPAGDDRTDDVDRADRILRSRAQLSPFYQAAVAGRREQLAVFREREREQGQASLALAVGTDRFPLAFRRVLPMRAQIGGLGGVADAGAVTVVLSIPAFAADSAVGQVRVRVVAWDRVEAAVRAVDTTLALEAPQRGEVRAAVRLPLPEGRYSVRVAVEAAGAGALVGRDGLEVGTAPGLSDVAIGRAAREAASTDADLADPRARFVRSDTIAVAARAVGAGFQGGRFWLEYRMVRTDGKEDRWRAWPGQERPVGIGTVEGSVHLVARGGLARFRPGVYDVDLVVADGAGRTIRSGGRITVEEGGLTR